jgi:hypothetical protein
MKIRYISILISFLPALIFSQIECPSFKNKGRKSPTSSPFITAMKFELDGLIQRNRLEVNDKYGLIFTPLFTCGVEQSLTRHFSFSVMTGVATNRTSVGTRVLTGDVRYYFNRTYLDEWICVKKTFFDSPYERNKIFSYYSLHYGVTRTFRRIFTHYDVGVGYEEGGAISLSLGVATGLKLN